MAVLFANDTIANSPEPESGLRLRNRWVKNRKAWLYLPDKKINLGVAPKCGSSSIYKAVGKNYYHPVHFNNVRSIWVVRHPVDRFVSLYENKCVRGGRINRAGEDKGNLKGWSFEKLLRHVESGKEWNHHWAPQKEMEDKKATEFVPLEELDLLLEELGLPLLHQNVTKNEPYQPSKGQIARIERLYEDDLRLYEEAI